MDLKVKDAGKKASAEQGNNNSDVIDPFDDPEKLYAVS
jgi:hypothetical protein